jgi:hypothetical protein
MEGLPQVVHANLLNREQHERLSAGGHAALPDDPAGDLIASARKTAPRERGERTVEHRMREMHHRDVRPRIEDGALAHLLDERLRVEGDTSETATAATGTTGTEALIDDLHPTRQIRMDETPATGLFARFKLRTAGTNRHGRLKRLAGCVRVEIEFGSKSRELLAAATSSMAVVVVSSASILARPCASRMRLLRSSCTLVTLSPSIRRRCAASPKSSLAEPSLHGCRWPCA